MKNTRRVRALLATLATIVTISGLAACTANPPPPVQQSDTPPPPAPTVGTTISVATDSLGAGFNPHLVADQSQVTTAVSALTLPSAFRPVDSPAGPQWRMDTALLQSAEVTSQAPFTVTYRISPDAQWSDALPVTAGDFDYLWQQMTSQPGTVASAGYGLIDSVQSRGGGKEAVVTFRNPYPAWRELFTGILPSHVLSGAPKGFQSAMDSGMPVSAGQYLIFSIDSTRDEIRLRRNDRYWGAPGSVDQIVLHRVGTQSQLAESVRSGDSSVVALAADDAVGGVLGAISGVRVGRTSAGRALEVAANTRTSVMSNPSIRQAVLGVINPQVIRDASAGTSVVTAFNNPVMVPTDPGFFPMDLASPTPAKIAELLRAAGYTPQPGAAMSTRSTTGSDSDSSTPPSTTAPGSEAMPKSIDPSLTSQPQPDSAAPTGTLAPGAIPMQRDGHTLVVRIGVAAGDVRTRAAADSVADQLQAAGIATQTQVLTSAQLYGPELTKGRVDLTVGWRSATTSPATRLASMVACDPSSNDHGDSVTPTQPPSGESSSSASTATPQRLSGSITGVCDPELSMLASRAITEQEPNNDIRTAAEKIADLHVRLPIYQDSLLTAVGPGVKDVALQGPVSSAIFGTAGQWKVVDP